MKKLTGLLALSLLLSLANAQSIHGVALKDIDGNNINLSTYQGTKVLVIIAPVQEGAVISIHDLDSFRNLYGTKIKLIGVMSREDGYLDSNKVRIKSYYQQIGSGIVLTEPMYTRKASGNDQSNLMKWLTTKSLNLRSDEDVKGLGHKFFISPEGKLFSVLPPELMLFSVPVTNNVIRKN